MRTWAQWADDHAKAYKREHSTSVAPVWLHGRTPWLAARMWLSEGVRHRGTAAAEGLARALWPGKRS